MKKRNEVSLLGALVICAVAIVIHKLLHLPEHPDSKTSGLKETEMLGI